MSDTIELDEGYFTTGNPSDDKTPLKRGIGSQPLRTGLIIRYRYADNHIINVFYEGVVRRSI